MAILESTTQHHSSHHTAQHQTETTWCVVFLRRMETANRKSKLLCRLLNSGVLFLT